jgi:hypothetical protein
MYCTCTILHIRVRVLTLPPGRKSTVQEYASHMHTVHPYALRVCVCAVVVPCAAMHIAPHVISTKHAAEMADLASHGAHP